MMAAAPSVAQPPDHESGLMIFMKVALGAADTMLAVPADASPPVAASGAEPVSPDIALYPDTPAFRTHSLKVGDGHVLHVQEHGNPQGLPALVLHGGPGSGCSPLLRRFFDSDSYRLICMDQRGAGLSRPHGEIRHNTTAHLLADLRTLRTALDIERWLVVGGSWGATLALAHAADEPQAIAGLLLRASFAARAEDIHAFFQDDTNEQPPAWQAHAWKVFAAHAPAHRRSDLLPWLAEVLAQGEPQPCRTAALAWLQWEQSLASGSALPPAELEGSALEALIARYRVQSHYLLHGCWLDKPSLLDLCAKVPAVPTLLLHGKQDRICRADSALAIHQHLPHSRLQWLDDVGHDPTHPAMVKAMVRALKRYAEAGDFEVQP